MENDLIVAPATPWGVSALAVLRASGPGTVAAVARICENPRRILDAPGNALRRALLVDPESDEVLDDVMLGIYRAPHSYTGEESVEIFCHGSPPGVRRILAVLYRVGFRPAEPGEFTLRAFLAGKIDLTRAEAVHEIVQAQTARGHEMALARLGGSIAAAIDESKRSLVQIMAAVAVQLDYPEEDTGEVVIPPETVAMARRRLAELAETYRTGRLFQEGARVALAGRTNAGKSSLFNALLREERSIVSETHGTTRDYIESRLDLEGIPVVLFDTAGLRMTEESIEGEGIRRTRNLLENADLVVYVVDGSRGIEPEDRTALATAGTEGGGRSVIPVWNKIDDPAAGAPPGDFVSVSATTYQGIEKLVGRIVSALTPDRTYREGSPVIDSLRQKNLLDRAVEALGHVEEGLAAGYPVDVVSLDLQEAINALGEITGEVTSEDILDAVFGGFCLGK
jgi:tRNA modification GTPase